MSDTVKLSKSQQELVDAMKAGVVIHYMPYAGRFNPKAYYFRSDSYKRVTAAAQALLDKGVAHKTGRWQNIKLELKSTAPSEQEKS